VKKLFGRVIGTFKIKLKLEKIKLKSKFFGKTNLVRIFHKIEYRCEFVDYSVID
jgi:hypothetical protein